jgi:hypothetical protein
MRVEIHNLSWTVIEPQRQVVQVCLRIAGQVRLRIPARLPQSSAVLFHWYWPSAMVVLAEMVLQGSWMADFDGGDYRAGRRVSELNDTAI